MEKFEVYVHNRIYRSAEEIFQAIIDPDKITSYFVSGSSNFLEKAK